MMLSYILKLLLMVPLVAGMAYGAIWLWRKAQPGMNMGNRDRLVSVVDAIPMGTTGRLAVVEFEGKRLLLSVSRGQIQLLSESAPASLARTAAEPALRAAPFSPGDVRNV